METKLKTLGVVSSITGWLSIIAAVLGPLVILSEAHVVSGATLIAAIIMFVFYGGWGIASLGLRVVADSVLEEKTK